MAAKPDSLRVQIARLCSEKAVCGSRTLKKLNDKHRQGAMLIARGMTFRQIGEELGGHPGYWGQLARWSPLFQECVEHYRQILENARNRALEVQRAENVRRQRRRTRPVTPFVSGIIVERRARAERLRQAEAQVRQLKLENAKLARQLKEDSRRLPSQPPASPRSPGGGLFAGGPLRRSYGRR